MNTSINKYIVKTQSMDWKPLVESGFHYKGIWVKSLHYDEDTARSPSILLKFDPLADYPYHNHPAGEELMVLKGSCIIESTMLKAGDYLYTPPGFKHGVTATTEGCEIFFRIPEEVQIMDRNQ